MKKMKKTRNWFSEQIDMKSFRPNENWSVCTRVSFSFSFFSFKFLRQFSFLCALQYLLVLLSFCQLLFRFYFSFLRVLHLIGAPSRCDHNAITCSACVALWFVSFLRFWKSLLRCVNFECIAQYTEHIP